jgi:hypothetical protein
MYFNGGGWELIGEFEEKESGKRLAKQVSFRGNRA